MNNGGTGEHYTQQEEEVSAVSCRLQTNAAKQLLKLPPFAAVKLALAEAELHTKSTTLQMTTVLSQVVEAVTCWSSQ